MSTYRILLCLLLSAMSSCSPARLGPTDSLVHRLRNRGAVPLSSDNPYLVANLVVSREMEASPEIKGFIQHRGAPAAIEVESGLFSPLVMQFYYPENREQFTLEEAEGAWIIRGPEVMERDKLKEVASLTRDSQGAPKLAFNTTVPPISGAHQPDTPFSASPKSKQDRTKGKEQAGQREPLSPKEGDPFLARLDDKGPVFRSPGALDGPRKPREPHFPGGGPAVSTEQERELVQDLIKAAGHQPAETTPRGDIVHYITFSGETLSMIARWYSFDRSNAARIARINRLADPDRLAIGDSVVIPAYLVRNSTRLSEEAVRALSERNP